MSARVITPTSYHAVPADRALADEILRRAGIKPYTVTRITVDEHGTTAVEQLVLGPDGRPEVRDGDFVRFTTLL